MIRVWLKKKARRVRVVLPLFPIFFRIALSREGLFSRKGRILIWGKIRRSLLSLCPPLVHYLQKKYGLSGGCKSCGASCKLLFQCPYWNEQTHMCNVYEDRPNVCRLFPLTPSDIRDRNLVLLETPCGFLFQKKEEGEKKDLPQKLSQKN